MVPDEAGHTFRSIPATFHYFNLIDDSDATKNFLNQYNAFSDPNSDEPKFVVILDYKIDSPYRDVEHLNFMRFLEWAGK